MNNINYDYDSFTASKASIGKTYFSMNDTLSTLSDVKASIPENFSGSDIILGAINEIEVVCNRGEAIVSTYDEWEALLNSMDNRTGNLADMVIDNSQWIELIKLYPALSNISDQRKAIIMLALTYLGQDDADINWLSGTWCAKFAGGIINTALGTTVIANTASVAKVLGLSGNPEGIAYTQDGNYGYVLSRAYTWKYNKYNSEGSGLKGWETAIDKYNKQYGNNVSSKDWID